MKNIKRIMKDEEGLTLVELLAVVVIMAIIAGIAAVSISKVIQRTREDAQVSNVQQIIASANLYDIQEEDGLKTDKTLEELKEAGTIKAIDFAEKPKDIKVSKNDTTGEVSVSLPVDSLMAGKKGNKLESVSEESAASLTREKLFGKTVEEAGK